MRNPYTFGSPIDKPDRFFGRESLLSFIEDNLRQNVKFILLHGHRRIGKSSVLKQIPKKIGQDEFAFVHFDLQPYSKSKLSEILHKLIEEIVVQLGINLGELSIPKPRDLENNIDVFARSFLNQIYEKLSSKQIVLLLDEFDVICDDSENILDKGSQFFRYLDKLLRQQDKLLTIAVAGREPSDLGNLLQRFESVPYQEIGLLDELSAKRLIRNPAQGTLEFEPEAITAILKITAGHPYFIQVICFTIFNIFIQTQNNSKWIVTREDIENKNVIEKAIEHAEGGLDWFWIGLHYSEKVILSAIAEWQNKVISSGEKHFQEISLLLENYGIIPTEELKEATNSLAKKGLLDNTECKIKIEFVCRWLAKRHPLRQLIKELEKIHIEEVPSLVNVGSQLYAQGIKHEALNSYNQALALNQNNFATLLRLAELNLELKNFDESLKLYERAYKVDPKGNKEQLLRALKMFGSNLTAKGEYTKAKEQYNRVLELEPEELSAKQRLEEIYGFESHSNYNPSIDNINLNKFQALPVKTIGLVAGIIAFVSISFVTYRILSPCLAGQRKGNLFSCVAETIKPISLSRGEKTLFPTIHNSDRNLGIAAFNQDNYEQAADYFSQAVQREPNDPEVLIYYNNALAHTKQKFVTFAVAVPITNDQDSAQAMLRGVAQAQNEFNANGGYNGQLLEIVIADDAHDQQEARSVAQELVKDKSVLAIIGHSISGTTKEALYEYQTEQPPLAVISPASSNSQLKADFFFRTTPSNSKDGQILAEYIHQQGLKKVVVFYNQKGFFSNDMRERFEREFERLGGQVFEGTDLAAPNFNADQALTESVSKSQAQAIVFFPEETHIPAALEIMKARAKSSNPQVQKLMLFGSSGLYSHKQTLTDGSNAVEGLIITVPWFREASQSRKFAQKAEKQWRGKVDWYTATSYDATKALINAISSNPSRTTVLQKLQQVNLSSQQTSGSPVKFEQGEIQTQPVLVKVEGGKFKLLSQ
jgi:ABC-type branched-subunit amino acid transport system substrate-binding protein